MAKRSSLFGAPASAKPGAASPEPVESAPSPAATQEPGVARRYPVAKTREGKRVVTAYLEREAKRQLEKIAFDEEVTIQELLVEGINAVFQARGLSRIA